MFLSFLSTKACQVTTDKGSKFDLSDLANYQQVWDVSPDDDEKGLYKYKISFCEDNANCQGNTGNFIRERDSSTEACLGIYGQWNGSENKQPEETDTGFSMNFESEYYCSDDFSRKYESKLNFICDPDASPEDTSKNLVAKKWDTTSCAYTVDITTSAACSSAPPPPSPGTCKITAQGTEFDLSPILDQNNGTAVFNVAPGESAEIGKFKYQISLCGDGIECQGNKGAMIKERDSSLATCLGIYGEWSNPQNQAILTPNGFALSLKSPYYCPADFSKKMSAVYNFICDTKATNMKGLKAYMDGEDQCEYTVDIRTPQACSDKALKTIRYIN